jgi:D-amino-acid oxidase
MGPRVTVVGAGVVGLSSAVRLAEAGHQVDVLARDLPLETTSATAGGLWLPFLAEPAAAVARWAQLTLHSFLDLADLSAGPGSGAGQRSGASQGSGAETGVAIRDGYLLGLGPERPAWSEGLPQLGLAEVVNPTPKHDVGWHLRVPLVDMTLYLPYLVRRLKAAGGTMTRLPLTALPNRGLVVNCTGLASRALAHDPSMRPVRGQVIWMTNPGLTTWWSDDTDPELLTYVLPHARHVVVGGTADPDDWSTTPVDGDAARILERALDLVPALRSASVLSHRVGLRPSRPTVRLETVPGPEGTIVHCYGHGGSGVTVSWGCADDVLAEVSRVTG